LFVISVYVVGIVPFVIHDVVVDGWTERVASIVGVISRYNAAETVGTEGMGETALAERMTSFAAVHTGVRPSEEAERQTGCIFVVKPGSRVPLAGLFGMEEERLGNGEGATVAELGVVVMGVSYESPASEVGVETADDTRPDETVVDGGHAGNPVDGVPF
jgi:hypothetical protein